MDIKYASLAAAAAGIPAGIVLFFFEFGNYGTVPAGTGMPRYDIPIGAFIINDRYGRMWDHIRISISADIRSRAHVRFSYTLIYEFSLSCWDRINTGTWDSLKYSINKFPKLKCHFHFRVTFGMYFSRKIRYQISDITHKFYVDLVYIYIDQL